MTQPYHSSVAPAWCPPPFPTADGIARLHQPQGESIGRQEDLPIGPPSAGAGVQWRRYNRRGDSPYKPRDKGLSTAAKEAANATARLDPPTPPSEMAAPVTVPDPSMSEEEYQIDDRLV